MIPVKSSQISAIGYDADTQRLRIRFTPKPGDAQGPLYQYYNVPPDVAQALRTAPSVGSYFIHNIKRRADLYPYVKLDPVMAAEAARSVAHLRSQDEVVDYLEQLPDGVMAHPMVQQAVRERAAKAVSA